MTKKNQNELIIPNELRAKNETVKYDNIFNDFAFLDFKEMNLDVFFLLYLRNLENEGKETEIAFSEIKDYLGIKERNAFIKDIIWDTIFKLHKSCATIEREDEEGKYTIFYNILETGSKVGKDKMSFKFDRLFAEEMAKVIDKFTYFDIKEFLKVKGKYAKNLFRFFMQYKNKGYFFIEVEKLKKIANFDPNIRNADLLRQIRKDIKQLLDTKMFSYIKLKTEKKKGERNVHKLHFSFRYLAPEVEIIDMDFRTQEDIKIEALQAEIERLKEEKAKKYSQGCEKRKKYAKENVDMKTEIRNIKFDIEEQRNEIDEIKKNIKD